MNNRNIENVLDDILNGDSELELASDVTAEITEGEPTETTEADISETDEVPDWVLEADMEDDVPDWVAEADAADSFKKPLNMELTEGVINGAVNAGHAVSDLMADGGNALIRGFEKVTGNDVDFRLSAPKPANFETGIAGDFAEGITRFTLGFVGGSNALRAAGWGLKGSKALKAGHAMTAGAIADFTVFTEEEERLSNLIQSVPALENPVTEFLAADPEDGWAEGRFKNALEGAGLGLALGAIYHGVRGFKKAADLHAAGKTEEAAKVMDDSRAEVAREYNEKIDPEPGPEESPVAGKELTTIDAKEKSSGSAKEEPPKPEQTATEKARGLYKGLNAEEIEKLIEGVKNGEDLANFNDAFNPLKWDSTDEGMAVMDGMIAELRDKNPNAFTDVQTLETVEQMAKDLLVDPHQLMEAVATRIKDADQMAAELLALRIKSITLAKAAPKLAQEIQTLKSSGNVEGVDVLERKLLEMMQYATQALDFTKTYQKNAARAVGQGRKKAGEIDELGVNISAEQFVQAAKDFDGDMDAFVRYLAEISDKPSWVQKAMAKAKSTRTWDIINEFYINSILSGPMTHVINITSNAIETGIKPVEGAMGAYFRGDKAAAKMELGTYAGLRFAAADSFQMAKQSLMKERNYLDVMHRVDDRERPAAINLKLNSRLGRHSSSSPADEWMIDIGAAIRVPSRFLSAADEFFKQINYRARVYSEAMVKGEAKGLTGKVLEDHAKLAVEKSFDPITQAGLHKDSIQYAREATFTEDLGYGVGKALQDMNSKNPAMRQILPFVRTPTNLYRNTIRRTPLFIMDQKARADIMGTNGPKAKSEQLAKLAVGSSFITAAAFLSAEDRIIGGAPKHPDLRRQFYDSGRKEYSFTGPGGQIFSFNRFDPRFAIFGIVADITKHAQDLPEEEQSLAAWLPIAALSFSNNMTSKSYLRGVSETIEVLQSDDPAKWQRYFSRQTAARVVPYSSLLRWANPDNEIKELRDTVDGIMSILPFMSENVEPRRNVLGQPMLSSNPVFGKTTSSAVKEELYQLNEGFSIPSKRVAGTRVDLTNYKNDKGQTAYDRLQQLTGELKISGRTLEESLDKIVSSSSYQRLPKLDDVSHLRSQRAELLSSQIRSYRNYALRQVKREYPNLDQDIKQEERAKSKVKRQGSSALQQLLAE